VVPVATVGASDVPSVAGTSVVVGGVTDVVSVPGTAVVVPTVSVSAPPDEHAANSNHPSRRITLSPPGS
jgi:hypothetical protein